MIGKRILKLAWTVHNCRGWFILERITEVASTGSWSERSMRFPWTASRSRSSLSIRIPITILAGVMEEVLSLLIINIAARRRPPFGMFPLLGRGRSAVCPPRLASKSMKSFSAQKYGALCQHSTGLSCRQRHHDPSGLLTTTNWMKFCASPSILRARNQQQDVSFGYLSSCSLML